MELVEPSHQIKICFWRFLREAKSGVKDDLLVPYIRVLGNLERMPKKMQLILDDIRQRLPTAPGVHHDKTGAGVSSYLRYSWLALQTPNIIDYMRACMDGPPRRFFPVCINGKNDVGSVCKRLDDGKNAPLFFLGVDLIPSGSRRLAADINNVGAFPD